MAGATGIKLECSKDWEVDAAENQSSSRRLSAAAKFLWIGVRRPRITFNEARKIQQRRTKLSAADNPRPICPVLYGGGGLLSVGFQRIYPLAAHLDPMQLQNPRAASLHEL